MAPYGMLANLLAMPVVSAWVMPAGMLALLAMPFGFDDFFWRLMGDGLQWMIDVALWVASLPGAVGRVTAFGTGALLVITAGMLVVCLLRTPLRWIGALILAFGILWAVRTPLPDVLVAQGADLVGVRTAGGNFSIDPQRKSVMVYADAKTTDTVLALLERLEVLQVAGSKPDSQTPPLEPCVMSQCSPCPVARRCGSLRVRPLQYASRSPS